MASTRAVPAEQAGSLGGEHRPRKISGRVHGAASGRQSLGSLAPRRLIGLEHNALHNRRMPAHRWPRLSPAFEAVRDPA